MPDLGRVGILISGRGSNMIALLDAMEAGRIAAEPVVVISNRKKAAGLETAAARGVRTEVLSHREIRPREEHERQVIACLKRQRVDLVCLAGYMRLLSPLMVQAFSGRMLNIHPSLLPAFPGLDAQSQALEYGVKLTGCSVHFVDEECDHGPVVLQAPVPVLEGDTEESLSERILEQEHRIYPEAVALFFQSRLKIDGRRCCISTTAQSG